MIECRQRDIAALIQKSDRCCVIRALPPMPQPKRNTTGLSGFIETHPLPVLASVAIAAFVLGAGAASWILFNGYVPSQLYTLQTELDSYRRAKSLTAGAFNPQSGEPEWPALSDQQIKEWAKALGGFKIKSIYVYWGQEVEARRFFRSLQALGKELQCEVKASGGAADGNAISLLVARGDPAGPALLGLFQQLGWPVELATPEKYSQGSIGVFIPQKSQ